MRQLIDQRQLWASCQEGVEVHLLQRASLVLDALSGNHLHAVEQCFGFLPTVGLDDSHDNVDAFLQASPCCRQHFVCLAYARCRADEDLQAPARLLLRCLQ